MAKRFDFEVSSTVLKRFCPLESKNTFVLVLGNLFGFQKNYFFDPKSNFSAIFLTNKNAFFSMYFNSMT